MCSRRRSQLPRRYAFRYVKIEIIATSPNYALRIGDVKATAVTSGSGAVPPLPPSTPELLQTDRRGQHPHAARVHADGLRGWTETRSPPLDRRSPIAGAHELRNGPQLRSRQAVSAAVCRIAARGWPRRGLRVRGPDDRCAATNTSWITRPSTPRPSSTTRRRRTTGRPRSRCGRSSSARWSSLTKYVSPDGVFADPGGWWIFIDWSDPLERTAAMHGVLLYSLRYALELARKRGRARKRRITRADRADDGGRSSCVLRRRHSGVFVSGPKRQVSWATQAWMALSGVASREEGRPRADGGESARRAPFVQARHTCTTMSPTR